jgi:hypothetical protein
MEARFQDRRVFLGPRSVALAFPAALLAIVASPLACNNSATAREVPSSLQLASKSFTGGDVPKQFTATARKSPWIKLLLTE